MTSLASERSWLLDPSVLKLVHQCRRLIHTEFGVKLHLTEEHLEQQLADYARKTRSSQLTRTWETLKDQVPQLNLEPEEDDDGFRRNRGDFLFQPQVAGLDLGALRLLVNAPVPAAHELEMLDGIRDVGFASRDTGIVKRPVEKPACRPDERSTLLILLITRLLADEDEPRIVGSRAEHRLGRLAEKRAPGA